MMQKIIVVCVVAFFNVVPAFAIPTLNMGPATITAATVFFPVTLASSAGTSISGISADIVFNPDEFDLVMDGTNVASATAGVAATASGKQVYQTNPRDGVLHIIIVNLAQNTAIADGVVAQISFSIRTGAMPGNFAFTIVPSATDSQGNNIAISSANGVAITLPGITAQLTISDALKVLQAVAGITQLNPTERMRYDVAPLGSSGTPLGNGVLDAADIILILRRSIGIGSW
jgi:hypothetical protein